MSAPTLATPINLVDFTLDDKYSREDGTIFLTGIQALVRLPLDQHRADARAGLKTATFISGYRGSPLGGYDIELDRQKKLLRANAIVHQPGLNEELAATAVFGSQMAWSYPGFKYDGVLGIWYGKAQGVDRSGDVFKHANYAGIGRNGGVLAVGGDDPASKSSTLPSDSEAAFYDALMPVLYPGNTQEVLDLGLHGLALSRAAGLWVAFKAVTNVCDGAGTALVSPERIRPIIPEVEFDGRPYKPSQSWYLLPPANLEMERTLHEARLRLASDYAWENELNQITVRTTHDRLGIMAAGKTYHDLRQALDELGLDDEALRRLGVRLLQLGMIFPLEPRIVREFAEGLQEILVVEEKRPFLEVFLKEILYDAPHRPTVTGKSDEQGRPLLPRHGEFDAEIVARAVAGRLERLGIRAPSVEARLAVLDATARMPLEIPLVRQPYYCSGCPHNTSTRTPDGAIVGLGIGCHSMALWMDPEQFGGQSLGITQMGGEGAQWVGASPFVETEHIFQNIGDGTLAHSGELAMDFAIAAGVNITYKLLYNSAVAMTGGQDAVGGLPVPALTYRFEAEGVKRIIVTSDDPDKYRGVALARIAEVWPRERIIEAQEELAKVPGVTVLIHDQRCAAESRRLRKRGKLAEPATRVYINERVCEGCGDCGHASNCLSVEPIDTEFGRKTQIHQASCNKDYSCLKGDCPAFLKVVPVEQLNPETVHAVVPPPSGLPEPRRIVRDEPFTVHMMGIGGMGVVTVNQVLGTAALLDGKQVWGLDQTGLSQKGGPVVSDLRISSRPIEGAKLSAGGADLYLAYDLLVATDPKNLAKADPSRTVAVISTSKVATGGMVSHTNVRFPGVEQLVARIQQRTRRADDVVLDAQAIAETLCGSNMQSNVVALGAAYQAGAVPIALAAIEQAFRLNGAGVEANLAAFGWGRAAVATPDAVAEALRQALPPVREAPLPDASMRPLLDWADDQSELRRLLETRVPDLAAYQDRAYAERYVDFVRHVARAEQARTPGRTELREAVARYLYKLMAYKDEYEVARLHLDAAEREHVNEEFGAGAQVSWQLHPPLLRALGLEHKIGLGSWFRPGMQSLKAAKRLRGTPLDPFGYTAVRRTERDLPREYRERVAQACRRLTPENHAQAVELAQLPDMVRGYEQIKLRNVQAYEAKAAELMQAFA
jgi:indolepyruvate ferredoxin oxidoreductase